MIVPTLRRRSRPIQVVLAVVMVLAWIWPGSTPVAMAADDPANVLDRHIVDVAIVSPSNVPSAVTRERLLTLEPSPDAARGWHRLALLQRTDGSWAELTSLNIAGAGDPWLIDLGESIFAVLSAPADGVTAIATVAVRQDGLEVLDETQVALSVDAAAGADVNGDGSVELVVAGRAERRRLGVCLGTRLLILDPRHLIDARPVELRQLELDGAALGEFDGLPGAELSGVTRCELPGSTLSGTRFVGVRLADGHVTFETPAEQDPTSSPLAVDLDGDGRDELVVSMSRGLVVIDTGATPARTNDIATEPAIGLIGMLGHSAVGRSDGGPPVVATMAAGSAAVVVGPLSIGADGPVPMPAVLSEPMAGIRWSRALAAAREAVERQEPVIGLSVDLGGDGCPDLIMPLLIVACGDPLGGVADPPRSHPGQNAAPSYVFRHGPAWNAARPLALVGTGTLRRMLIAQSVDWDGSSGLRAPTPLPAWQAGGHGGWRAGPSQPFVLAELSLPDLLYFPAYPAPSPTMELRATGRPSVVLASGWTGTNYFVRIVGMEDGDPDPSNAPGLAAFLAPLGGVLPRAASGTLGRLVRIGVPDGHAAGTDTAAATIPLEDVRTRSGAEANRWTVTFVAVNAWGELSEPIRGVVLRDIRGPALTVTAPFLSAPWPFSARIAGIAEPGTVIHVNGGPPLTTTGRGAFETRLTLAPWPQPVEFRAVDAAGNETVRVVSVIGGLDVRQLPWQVILAIVILAAVIGGTIVEGRRAQARLVAAPRTPGGSLGVAHGQRGRRRRLDVAWGADERDDLPLPEFEELTSDPSGGPDRGRPVAGA